MRDELEAPFLDEWLQATEVTPPDPYQGARRVASQLPHTKQVGRWLPFPVFHRKAKAKAKTPTATDTAEYQPSHFPATNGHSATAVGRTQTMFSPAKAITAGALVFAIGSVLLIAQPFQQAPNVPGATMPEPSEAVEFTAAFPWGPEVNRAALTTLGTGVVEWRDWAHRTTARSSSDPRFDGTMVYTCNSHVYPEAQGRLNDCVLRIENADGAWQSEPSLELDFGNASFGPFSVNTMVFNGEGDYAGLTAVVEAGDTGAGYEMHGLIVDGYLPPNAKHFDDGGE